MILATTVATDGNLAGLSIEPPAMTIIGLTDSWTGVEVTVVHSVLSRAIHGEHPGDMPADAKGLQVIRTKGIVTTFMVQVVDMINRALE